MPNPTPGAERISLTDRVKAFLDPERIIWNKERDLNAVQFGPGTPIEPMPIAPGQTPRQFEYTSGVNLSITPRGEYPKLALTPFQSLRNLARLYDVAGICIETRINWICSANWSVTARDKRTQATMQPICNQVERFFRRPDRVTPFPTWLRTVLLDQLEIDALTIYKQRDRLGRLHSLDYIDGSTIKPLLNERGKTAAYQQILYGYVRGEYDKPGMPQPDPWPAGGDLLYLPRWTSTDSPYGRSPTEQIILRVNMAIRKQTRDLAHWTDGNVPEGFMSPPDGVNLQPEQVRQFEDAFNADLAGIDRAANQVKFMPWNGNYTATKPFSYSREIDDFLLEIACASYHIPKNELGMTDKVNKASSQEQEDVAFRHAVAPDAKWLKEVLFDPIISDDLGHPELQFDWDFGKAEDEAATAQTEQADIAAGVITADESRRRRYPDLDGKAPGPPAQAQAGPVVKFARLWAGHNIPEHTTLNDDEVVKRYLDVALGEDRNTPAWPFTKADLPFLAKAAETVTTETGLVADDRAPKRKRKRGKRRPVDVAALIDSEAAGALDWAKKAAAADDAPAVAKVDSPVAPITIVMPPEAHDDTAVAQALDTVRAALEGLKSPVAPRVVVKEIERDGDGRMLRVTETERSDVD